MNDAYFFCHWKRTTIAEPSIESFFGSAWVVRLERNAIESSVSFSDRLISGLMPVTFHCTLLERTRVCQMPAKVFYWCRKKRECVACVPLCFQYIRFYIFFWFKIQLYWHVFGIKRAACRLPSWMRRIPRASSWRVTEKETCKKQRI